MFNLFWYITGKNRRFYKTPICGVSLILRRSTYSGDKFRSLWAWGHLAARCPHMSPTPHGSGYREPCIRAFLNSLQDFFNITLDCRPRSQQKGRLKHRGFNRPFCCEPCEPACASRLLKREAHHRRYFLFARLDALSGLTFCVVSLISILRWVAVGHFPVRHLPAGSG